MDTRLDEDVEATNEDSIVSLPPQWLLTLVAFLSPPAGENTGPGFIVKSLWWAHRSYRKVLARLPLAIARDIYSKTVEASYWKTSLAQACILFIFFWDVLTRGMILVMALTYAVLLVRDAYRRIEDMLEWHVFLLFLVPELLYFFGILVALLLPSWDVPLMVIWQRCWAMAAVIYLCRRLYSRSGKLPKKEHPYKDVLKAHTRAWSLACLWLLGFLAYLMTTEKMATPSFFGQAPLTITLPMWLFAISVRLQLNPIAGIHSKHEIDTTLSTDHIEKDLVIKRNYLLVGSNWLARPTLKSVLEMSAALFAAMTIPMALIRWYTGSSVGIDWLQLKGHAIAYAALLLMWDHVRKVHLRTQKLFDDAIARHRARKAMGLPI